MTDDIKINDKRRFDNEGNPLSDFKEECADMKKNNPEKESSSEKEPETSRKNPTSGLPEINFPTFVLSLATSAQIQLGIFPNPVTGKVEKDIRMAKQTIDVLGLLQDKTKGNLEEAEKSILEQALYELRMLYVQNNK